MGLFETLGLKRPKDKPGVKAGATAAPAQPATPQDEKKLLEAECDKRRTAIDQMRKHPQRARIALSLTTAFNTLTTARKHLEKNEFADVRKRLDEIDKMLAAARTLADKHAEFARQLAMVRVLVAGWKDIDDDLYKKQMANVDLARDKVALQPPQWTAAEALLTTARTAAGDALKGWVQDFRKKVADTKKMPGAEILDAEFKGFEAALAAVESAASAGAASSALMQIRKSWGELGVAAKTATRWKDFQDKRKAVRAQLDALKPAAVLAPRLKEQEQRLAEADAMATKARMQFESAIDLLASIATVAAALSRGATAAATYDAERKPADQAFAALQGHASADAMKAPLNAAKVALDSAAQLAQAAVAAPEPAGGFADATALVRQAAAGLKDLGQLGKDLAPVLQAQKGAKAAKDAGAIRTAIAALRKEGQAAQAQPHADVADAEFKRFAVAINQADADVGDGNVPAASDRLVEAGDALVAARTAQVEATRLKQQRDAVEARRKVLADGKTAAAIKPRLDPVGTALQQCDAAIGKRDWPAGMTAMVAAQAAIEAAEVAHTGRLEFEKRDKAVRDDGKKLKDADLKKNFDALLLKATGEATACRFPPALRLLDEADVCQEGEDLLELAKSDPNGQALLDSADKMIKKGGAKALDALVEKLPVSDTVIAELVKKRFGKDLTVDAGGQAVKSAKRIYAMLAKVPEGEVRNPSLKKIQRVRSFRDEAKTDEVGGGYYDSSQDLVVMNGRPGMSDQAFGAAIASEIPPDQQDPDCKPVKPEKAVDYFDFATLHEVGHSIDDAKNFMGSRGKGADYGGWIEYGGNVEPIASAVAAWCGYDKSPEQKRWVYDKIVGNEPEDLVHEGDTKEAADKARVKFDDWYGKATSATIGAGGVWWDHAASMSIAINGRIYQEAYKRTWVSYLAAARTKGLTGYQFRAPGEWFAELYAAFRSDKLGPKHPARAWLSKLSV
ncbi:MAG: hypothetical protein KF788_07215 [Piscinibacter sp.]|nr:hypothetical protein [Piscinibacter sp.]